ncbi:MAG: NRDE family protein, partial [Zoogloea sp.]
MCLILAAWGQHPEFPLIIAANRDEYFARPAAPLGWWPTPA